MGKVSDNPLSEAFHVLISEGYGTLRDLCSKYTMEQVEHFARIALRNKQYKLIDLALATNTAMWGDERSWKRFMDRMLPKKEEYAKEPKVASKQDMESLKNWSKGRYGK